MGGKMPKSRSDPSSESAAAASGSPVESFSIMGGGPLFRLIRRMRLSSDQMEFLPRRILIAILLTWVPVALLSAFEGHALGSAARLPFLKDIDLQARLLLALPLLLFAEVNAFVRMRPVLPEFLRRDMVPESDRKNFERAVGSARRWRDSAWAEVLLLLFVYAFGVNYLWKTHLVVAGATWYATPLAGGGRQLTAAGWWYAIVSLPIWQFLLVRWYYRLVIWARLLFQISRIDLRLIPTHPDHCGGLGFLAPAMRAFSTLLVVHGTLLGGTLANRIFFRGGRLLDYKMQIGVYAALMLLLVLGPTFSFTPELVRLKRVSLREYGAFANDYVRDFDRKWVHGPPPAESPLGSADIQSLADLGNSYDLIRKMQFVPFNRPVVVSLLLAALLPIAPLVLTVVPLEQLAADVLKMIF
jgi:hypothetical protein